MTEVHRPKPINTKEAIKHFLLGHWPRYSRVRIIGSGVMGVQWAQLIKFIDPPRLAMEE